MPRFFFQAYWGTQLVEYEVENGGFNQYFFNSSGMYADAAVSGFEFFGLRKHADLMRRVVAVANSAEERALREDARQRGSLEAFGKTYDATRLNAFDDEFNRLPMPVAAGIAYLRTHIADVAKPNGRQCPKSGAFG